MYVHGSLYASLKKVILKAGMNGSVISATAFYWIRTFGTPLVHNQRSWQVSLAGDIYKEENKGGGGVL